jgi:phage-related protein
MYQVFYYKTARGDCPFKLFVDGTSEKVRAKFDKLLDLLRQHGPDLKRPYADALRDGIRELRVGFGGDQYRALYFFLYDGKIVITHGIIKKTNDVPSAEIDRAIRYKGDFLRMIDNGELEI